MIRIATAGATLPCKVGRPHRKLQQERDVSARYSTVSAYLPLSSFLSQQESGAHDRSWQLRNCEHSAKRNQHIVAVAFRHSLNHHKYSQGQHKHLRIPTEPILTICEDGVRKEARGYCQEAPEEMAQTSVRHIHVCTVGMEKAQGYRQQSAKTV